MYQRLLVALDRTATSRLALEHAAALARLSGATVVLLHVLESFRHVSGFESPKVYAEEVLPRMRAAGRELLDEAAAPLREQGIEVETVLLEGSDERVAELIARRAEEAGVDLVILGTHGRRGVNRLLLGSDAEHVARIAPVPVMLVRSTDGSVPD
jgi:nucleotide-binding universal stress UspA family protein